MDFPHSAPEVRVYNEFGINDMKLISIIWILNLLAKDTAVLGNSYTQMHCAEADGKILYINSFLEKLINWNNHKNIVKYFKLLVNYIY